MPDNSGKETLTQLVLDYLVEIASGRCSITETQINQEPDAAVQQILAGLLMLYEDLQFREVERQKSMEQLRYQEEQLRQSQKMEAVGRLAGGVAHDFNNMLTVIIGYSNLVLGQMGERDDRWFKDLDEIRKAGESSAKLTQQLLAFSRKQVLQQQVLDLNRTVDRMTHLLQRTLGERIQLEQVVVNLALNARDAMPDGGKLTIETLDVELDDEYARQHAEVRPGPYVMLAVSDTGAGMDEAIQQHLFEPFFTTKSFGKGTGLGLATIYGTVKQNGGHIWVYSEVGKGATFKLYFPRVDAPISEDPQRKISPKIPQGTETVLVVEDEEAVRRFVVRALTLTGYTVLEARHGQDAVVLATRHRDAIQLLVTDVVMPGMNVKEMVNRVTGLSKGIKVLYMSGYTANVVVHHGHLDLGVNFMHKPFTAETMVRKVRDVLDEASEPPQGAS